MNKLIFGSFLVAVLLPFSVNAASINSIDPQYITPGETEVTIYGNGFGDSSLYKYLYFGSTPAYASSWGDSSITVKVPYSLYSSGNIEISGSFKIGQTCYGTYCYDKTEYMRVVGPKYYLLPQIVQTTDEIYNGAIFEVAGKYFGNIQGTLDFSGYSCEILKWQSNYIKCKVPEIYNQSGSVSYSIKVPESNNYQISDTVNYLKSISNDSHSYLQNYLTSSGITKVWDKYTGKGVVVAVIDGGVDINNYDLKESLWRNNGEIRNNNIDDDGNGFIDDYYGYNFIDRDANLFPSNSHGTAVAGIIAAKKNNGWGLAGIAPDAKIMNLKVCSSRGCAVQDVIDAIIYATDNGADIINLSLGGDGSLGYTPNYDVAIEYAYNKNVLIIASAGNGDTAGAGTRGQDISSVKASPVSNDGDKNYVLGVGAVDGKNNPTQWTNYSQDYVDVSAPGEDIPVLSVPVYDSGHDIDEMDGTSFSAPIVAGVAALLKEKNPQWKNYELMSQIISQSDKFSNGYNVYGNILNAKNILDNSYPNTELTSVYPTVFSGSGKLTIYGKNFHRDVKIHISNSNRSGDVPASVMTVYNNYVEVDLNKWAFVEPSDEKYTFSIESVYGSNKQILRDVLKVNKIDKNVETFKSAPVISPITEIGAAVTSENNSTPISYAIPDNYNVNIRENKSLSSKVLSVAKKGNRYEIINDGDLTWYGIKYDGGTGWVIKKYFRKEVTKSVSSVVPSPAIPHNDILEKYIIPNVTVNVRSAPSSGASNVIGSAVKGNKYILLDGITNKYWVQIQIDDTRVGWVAKWLVRVI